MNSVKYLAKCLSTCVGVLAVTGCVVISAPEPVEPEVTDTTDSVIAQDFMNIMVQIEALAPWSTVLQFGLVEGNPSERDARSVRSDNSFGKALRAAAGQNGYAMETVGSPSGPNYVSFSIAEFGDAVNGTTYTYDVSVGEVDFRRVYKPLDTGGVEPFKAMLVRGADVSDLESDDSIFSAPGAVPALGAAPALAEAPLKPIPTTTVSEPLVAQSNQVDKQPLDSSTNPTDSIAADITAKLEQPSAQSLDQPNAAVLERPIAVAAPLISDLPEPTYDGTLEPEIVDANSNGFETVRKINVAVSGESNYENLLADKQDVAEEILIFGDDSYVLGARNKKILGDMMGKFNPATDVVSVVGCSTGITKIVNGNAALAIGRANRVKEALLYSGVPHDKIFDEGCWSPNANSTPFPNRGVVITVKRNVDKG